MEGNESQNYTTIVEELNKFREELDATKKELDDVVEFNKALLSYNPQTKEEPKKEPVDINKYLKERGL